jgi:hypothetical protein
VPSIESSDKYAINIRMQLLQCAFNGAVHGMDAAVKNGLNIAV